MRPLIGISCCQKPFGIFFASPNHAASDSYIRVVRACARYARAAARRRRGLVR